jgi:hypothetical protein
MRPAPPSCYDPPRVQAWAAVPSDKKRCDRPAPSYLAALGGDTDCDPQPVKDVPTHCGGGEELLRPSAARAAIPGGGGAVAPGRRQGTT